MPTLTLDRIANSSSWALRCELAEKLEAAERDIDTARTGPIRAWLAARDRRDQLLRALNNLEGAIFSYCAKHGIDADLLPA
ncbi:hypothetical protein [Nocardiopsis synnemataformans]|uniref:hypothetical protein n=1 Tax=Nocardiopsis synnemataformans TaxID=61305 RepID=UPI003EBEDFCE